MLLLLTMMKNMLMIKKKGREILDGIYVIRKFGVFKLDIYLA
jgi:hypothetical protein